MYDKSYQHETVYDSYDLELAAHLILSVKFQNASKAYTLTGKVEFNIKNKDEKYLLYKMFVAYQCDGNTSAPLTQYKNNEVYQGLVSEYDYRGQKKDDRIYIDMRRSKGDTDELETLTRDDIGFKCSYNFKRCRHQKITFARGWVFTRRVLVQLHQKRLCSEV